MAEAAAPLREHHDLDGFLGETPRRWTGRGEEGSGRKPRRPRHEAHVRNLAFPVREPRRGARPRGREPPSRIAAARRRAQCPSRRTRETAGDSGPSRLGTRGRRESRVRRHLAHAPRTSPSRRTSCRRARPLGSDARRSSEGGPRRETPRPSTAPARRKPVMEPMDAGATAAEAAAPPNLPDADVHRGANANGGGSDAEHVSNCRVHVSDTTRRSAQTILARSTKRVGRGLTCADARGSDGRARRTRGSTASVDVGFRFYRGTKSPENDPAR